MIRSFIVNTSSSSAYESVDILVFNMSVRLILKLTNYNPPKPLDACLVYSLQVCLPFSISNSFSDLYWSSDEHPTVQSHHTVLSQLTSTNYCTDSAIICLQNHNGFNGKYNHAGVRELAILPSILEVLFSNLSQKTCCTYRRLWNVINELCTECSA
jgi:hypothetical protein